MIKSLLLATTFFGNITGTEPNKDIWFMPGDAWNAEYRYESDSINGEFDPLIFPIEGNVPLVLSDMTLIIKDSRVSYFGFISIDPLMFILSDSWALDRYPSGYHVSDPMQVAVPEPELFVFVVVGLAFIIIRRIK